jgi:hypothetical protein
MTVKKMARILVLQNLGISMMDRTLKVFEDVALLSDAEVTSKFNTIKEEKLRVIRASRTNLTTQESQLT